MTQEEKQLLLKDLCARLPYGVKLLCANGEIVTLINPPITIQDDCWNFKPYLRPLSSMTEEEKEERHQIVTAVYDGEVIDDAFVNVIQYMDWLNAHHFDFRNLIEKGFAIEAPKWMYKTE